MDVVQEATLTLGQAARRLGTSVDEVLRLVYEGTLPAVPERATGRLLVDSADVERLRDRSS
ncbi:DNA-binding protein [Egibacter rhizosphaerae]|uniref:DNA-binding protein n=1 Tax=Egibacter rhizosphaerae TaxID=1670831 RepID=A0A411YBA4_9ACTN|nr:helix-turn-helix domain-containing protein [Egibacter rhizosphaerae]QBI18476.1 DNA-binding protein [Egibacter rhizosphaerae]